MSEDQPKSKPNTVAINVCSVGGAVIGFVAMMVLNVTTEVVPGGAIGGAIGGGVGGGVGSVVGQLLFGKK